MNMKKGKLVEYCGRVYRVIDKDVKVGDIIIFNEISQYDSMTIGKPYYVIGDDPVLVTNDDYSGEYKIKKEDKFMVLAELDLDDPIAIQFMMVNRESQIKWLLDVQEFHDRYHRHTTTYPEMVDVMLTHLKTEMAVLSKKLLMTDWLKEGAFVRTTMPIENMPAGSLVQVRWKWDLADILLRCGSLEEEYEDIIINIEPEHLQQVEKDDLDENERRIIDEFRYRSALKFAENLNNHENLIPKLEMEAWESKEVLRVVTGPFYPFRKADGGEYSEIDKNGMISFLITAKEHVIREELKKEIDAIINIVRELECKFWSEKFPYAPIRWEW